MKKNQARISTLQERIDAFQMTPIGECKVMQKNQQNKLKKIGRNKLVFKENVCPAASNINPNRFEQVIKAVNHKGKEN